MAFSDLFGMLVEPGEDGIPDTLYDDLSQAHLDEIGGRDAKIAEVTTQLEAANAEISRLKMQNYDLLMAIPVDGEDNGDSADDSDGGDSDESDGGVDSLFEN